MSKLLPQSVIIEKTALSFAAEMYEDCRSKGMTSKFKNARAYAKANFEMYIPAAINILLDMLNSPTVSAHEKDEIMLAMQERINAKGLEVLNEKIQPFKEPVARPVILNSTRFQG